MKIQRLAVVVIAVLLLIGAVIILQVRAPPDTNVYVDPALVERDPGTTPVGSTFTVSLGFGNMTDLGGMEYKLYWQSAVLNFVSVHDSMPWSGSPFVAANESSNAFNATYGRMFFSAVSMSGGFTGSTVFRTITFKIMSAPSGGETQISTPIAWGPYGTDVIFGDVFANLIPATAYSGQFVYGSGPPPDTTPPVTTDNYDGLWHTSDFTITLTATDDASGVAATYYIVNGGATKTISADGQPLITTEGEDNTLEYWSVDNANNIETHHLLTDIKLDKTVPTGSIIINSGAEETVTVDVTLTLTATDTVSGVDKIRLGNQLDLSSASWIDFSATKAWQLIPGDGEKTVYYQIRDVAGLISEEYSDSITLNTTASIQFQLTISVNGNGVTNPVAGTYMYTSGTQVSVAATADSGFSFDHWMLDNVDSGSVNPFMVTMDANHTLEAFFVAAVPTKFQLTINVIGNGTTTLVPGTYMLDADTKVNVTAIPDSGWVLEQWILDGQNKGTSNPFILTMNANHTLTAQFEVRGPVIPEFWLGPVLGIVGCFAALALFRLFRRNPNKIVAIAQ